MTKKQLLITLTSITAVFATGILTVTASGINQMNGFESLKVNGANPSKTHTVIFDKDDVAPGAYDVEGYCNPFSLKKENVIDDVDGNLYDIESVNYDADEWTGTFYYGDNENGLTFGGDSILSFTSNCGEAVYMKFSLILRAEIDESRSVINYYVGDDYLNAKFELSGFDEEDENRYFISAYFDCYSDSCYDQKIVVDSVKLVFTCSR